jgi:hypothetical protein
VQFTTRLRVILVASAAVASLVLVAAGSVAMELVTTLTLITVATLLFSGDRRHDALRRTRLLILAALVCAFASALMIGLYELTTGSEPPLPWIGDVVSLSYAPLTIAGMLTIPVGSRRTGHRARAFADGLLASASLWFLLVAFGRTHSFVVTDGGLAAVVAYAYPIGDVFVVATGLTVLARCAGATTRMVALMVAGLSVVAGSDVWMFVNGHEHAHGVVLTVVYQAGRHPDGAADAARPRIRDVSTHPRPRRHRGHRGPGDRRIRPAQQHVAAGAGRRSGTGVPPVRQQPGQAALG